MGAPPNHPTLDHFSLVYYNYIGTYGLGYRHLRKPPNHHLETLSCFLQRAKNWAVQHSPLDQMEASYGGDTLQNTHGWKRLHIQDRKIILSYLLRNSERGRYDRVFFHQKIIFLQEITRNSLSIFLSCLVWTQPD